MSSRPTISLCVPTSSPPDRVHALLTLLRPHVDEIVLSVDAAGDLDTLDACAELCDQRFVHALDRNPNWMSSWLNHQARGDWVLHLDDDEVPGAALLEALPELTADRYRTAYRIPRRWLVSADRWASGFPWRIETIARLVRNNPGLWHNSGGVHREGQWEGESHLVTTPLYHLAVPFTSIEQRRAKIARYETLDGGLVVDGVDMNVLYLPEDWPDLETEAVPASDRALIESVLAPAWVAAPPPPPARPAVQHATAAEIARHNRLQPADDSLYAARATVLDAQPEPRAGSKAYVLLQATNDGAAAWWRSLPPGTPAVRLAWRWRSADDNREISPPQSAPFSETVFPGATTRLWVEVSVPEEPGAYVLEVQMLHEGVCWFGEPKRVAIEVTASVG